MVLNPSRDRQAPFHTVNSPEADERFIRDFLARHGDPAVALSRARELQVMHRSGRLWWGYIVARLTVGAARV